MGRVQSICLASMGIAAMAAAQSIDASNSSVSSENNIVLTTSMGDTMVRLATLIPLTTAASRSLPPMGLSGTLFLANTTSALNVDSRDIAAINCDPLPGELQADYMFDQAVSANASAIVFYSATSETCTFADYDGSYAWVYAMQESSDTERLGAAIDASFDTEQELWGQIALSDTVQVSGDGSEGFGGRDLGSHAGDSSNDDDDHSPLGPSPTTAVAMIILYAITGIITALFLVIIVTGALRAHRHPERYGPRNVVGRPRQSRAKGIARAMLDTLPIVKFGQNREEDPKPTDVELGEQGSENRRQSADAQTTTDTGANEHSTQPNESTAQSVDDPAAPRHHSATEEGISAAVSGARRDSTTPNPDHLGCSICTEDFEEGQDQRVLPCDHRFHPDCVDPWLLNVSGTCPLCRIDLHPPAEEGELDENGNPIRREVDENGNPLPVDGDGAAAETPRMGVRRSLLIGLIGARSVDRMSREERLATLRQLRARQQQRRERETAAAAASPSDAAPAAEVEGQGQEAEQASSEDSSRIRSRLRRVLGVRTRRTEARAEGEPRS